jgi:hypothetical protein
MRTLTKRRTPMPANITFAGENICSIGIRARLPTILVDIYQTDAFTERSRECVQNVNCWVQPLFQSLIGIRVDLASKQVQYGGGRVTRFELSEERVALESLLRLFIVRVQGGLKYDFKFVGLSPWGRAMAHRVGCESLKHIEGMNCNAVDIREKSVTAHRLTGLKIPYKS